MRNKDTNLWLSPEELELFQNTGFFRAKSALIGHLTDILEHTRRASETGIQTTDATLNAQLLKNSGKISRGENYLGLPYLVLDYPAVFEKDGVLAFRTMAWWGHPFSVTFHVSGKYLKHLPDHLNLLISDTGLHNELFICINDQQWEHHHEANNYRQVKESNIKHSSLRMYAEEKGFFKLMIKVPVENADLLPAKAAKFISTILKGLT